jgi:plastocyanin
MSHRRTTVSGLALALVLGTLVVLAGCDKEDGRARPGGLSGVAMATPATTTAAPTANGTGATAAVPAGKGGIRGKVKYSGLAPVLKPTERDCHPGGAKVTIPDESVILAPGGELKNVIVFLKNPPAGGTPRPAPVVDQKDCIYVPHVIALQAGQEITFTSSDPVLHNVHVLPSDNGEMNRGMNKGDKLKFPVSAPAFFKVMCDVHPWMSCRVGVFEHPYFAVTKADGGFEFTDLPVGTYSVGVWHEKLGQRAQDVAVTADKAAEVTITIAK